MPTEERIGLGEALRAGAVMPGGPAVLVGAGVASGLASLRAVRRRRRPSPVALAGLAVAQLGQERGGFYSYEWLENLAGCEMRNADRIHPEWQQREVGELVMLHPANGLEVTRFEPGRSRTS